MCQVNEKYRDTITELSASMSKKNQILNLDDYVNHFQKIISKTSEFCSVWEKLDESLNNSSNIIDESVTEFCSKFDEVSNLIIKTIVENELITKNSKFSDNQTFVPKNVKSSTEYKQDCIWTIKDFSEKLSR